MKKRYWAILAAAAAYLGLLGLLVYAESFHPDASITTMGEAVWYSLVTLTTVGYGDYFPVTGWGRAIGVIFQLMSTGLLAFLVSMALSVMMGKIFPRMWLRLRKKNPWYIFSTWNDESVALAKNIEKKRDPEVS